MRMASPGGVFGVRRPDRSVGGMRRQGPVDRFDEAVGEDERIQDRQPACRVTADGSRKTGLLHRYTRGTPLPHGTIQTWSDNDSPVMIKRYPSATYCPAISG